MLINFIRLRKQNIVKNIDDRFWSRRQIGIQCGLARAFAIPLLSERTADVIKMTKKMFLSSRAHLQTDPT
jgi:hypothetical protein